MFLPHPRVKVSIVGSLRDREVACSVSDRQGLNFESCVWRTVSSQSSHHPQEVLLAQFSLYVHKGGLKPDSFHFISFASREYIQQLLDFFSLILPLKQTLKIEKSRKLENLFFYSCSAGIDFRHQNLTSTDVRFWRAVRVSSAELSRHQKSHWSSFIGNVLKILG